MIVICGHTIGSWVRGYVYWGWYLCYIFLLSCSLVIIYESRFGVWAPPSLRNCIHAFGVIHYTTCHVRAHNAHNTCCSNCCRILRFFWGQAARRYSIFQIWNPFNKNVTKQWTRVPDFKIVMSYWERWYRRVSPRSSISGIYISISKPLRRSCFFLSLKNDDVC